MADSNPLSDSDLKLIVTSYSDGVKLREIAASIGRSLGTVQTATYRLRCAGLIGRRYEEWTSLYVR